MSRRTDCEDHTKLRGRGWSPLPPPAGKRCQEGALISLGPHAWQMLPIIVTVVQLSHDVTTHRELRGSLKGMPLIHGKSPECNPQRWGEKTWRLCTCCCSFPTSVLQFKSTTTLPPARSTQFKAFLPPSKAEHCGMQRHGCQFASLGLCCPCCMAVGAELCTCAWGGGLRRDSAAAT